MTVRELIEQLQSLPNHDAKVFSVHQSYFDGAYEIHEVRVELDGDITLFHDATVETRHPR